MRAVVVTELGTPGRLEVRQLPDPSPAVGEVLVETEAIGVGGVDAFLRSGALSGHGPRAGQVLGSEVAGTVAAVGPGVDTSWVGRRAWAFLGARGGGYAELAVAPASTVVALPEGLSATDAVTVGSTGVVAHFALRQARLADQETVLVRGAAGGLGVMAVQLARHAGAASVAVTTSSAVRGRRLRELGATHVLDRAGTDRARGPSAYDVVIDVVAGPGMTDLLDRLNPSGRLVVIGGLGGPPPADLAAQWFARFQQSLTLSTFSAATVPDEERTAQVAQHFEAVVAGALRAVVHDRLALEDAAEAHRQLDSSEVFGRLVLLA